MGEEHYISIKRCGCEEHISDEYYGSIQRWTVKCNNHKKLEESITLRTDAWRLIKTSIYMENGDALKETADILNKYADEIEQEVNDAIESLKKCY